MGQGFPRGPRVLRLSVELAEVADAESEAQKGEWGKAEETLLAALEPITRSIEGQVHGEPRA